MNAYLSMRTIFVVVSMIGLILLVCMIYVRLTRKIYPGYNYWMASSVLYFFGNFLFGLRGVWPDLVSIVLANMVFMLLLWLIPYGLVVFAGRRHPLWPYFLPSLTIGIFAYHFSYISPHTNARIVVFSLLFAGMSAYTAILYKMLIQPVIKSANLLLAGACVCGALWSVVRAFYTLFYETNASSYLDTSIVQQISNLFYCGLFALTCFALCLLNFQKTEQELRISTNEVRELKGIIPICSVCKNIRDDKGYWNQVESYIRSHSDASFTHSICPECLVKDYPEYADPEPEGQV